MKIEKLENDKIKVYLTAEELLSYNISKDTVAPDSPGLHKFLFEIMESVMEETGFNPYSGQVVVEAVQDSMGITLFISKLKNAVDIKKTKIKSVKINKDIHKIRYEFNSFDNLCKAFKYVNSYELSGAYLYKLENKWYITVLSRKTALNSVFSEYCDKICEKGSDLFLKEHSELVIKGKKLINMVNGIKALD